MTGLSFSGLWYLNHLVALQWANIIFPRIQAGRDPIPAQFLQPDSASRAGRINTNFKDPNGFYDPYKADLYRYKMAGGGQVPVIPLSGIMMRQGACGGGNEYTAKILQYAKADPEVIGAVLNINSPGGTADSTRLLADAVRDFGKPILAFGPLMASAAYFVASQAREVWLEDQAVSQVGSIGSIVVYEQSAEDAKIQRMIIVSEGSEDKPLYGGHAGMTPELKAYLQQQVNLGGSEFKGYVRMGRAGRLQSEEALTGRMYTASQALGLGLIDRSGTLADAISRVHQFSLL